LSEESFVIVNGDSDSEDKMTGKIKKVCKFIVEPIVEVFQTGINFYETFNKGDKNIEDLIDQSKNEYLEKGWDMTTGVWLII
jgi:hypothetical protein